MDDKTIMSTVLTNVKSQCDLLMHGTIESSTANVHSTFDDALRDCMDVQNQIYCKMAEMGWYPMQQVEEQKINQTKQKFSAS
ncbi:MAG: spore coat protein [Oscillospiraceae bacterium]|jgi:spore coat protein CotF|nr:spore coat protein [Oscillospiraceae bacterium]